MSVRRWDSPILMAGICYVRHRKMSVSPVTSCLRTVVPLSHDALGMMAEDTIVGFGLDESVHFPFFYFYNEGRNK